MLLPPEIYFFGFLIPAWIVIGIPAYALALFVVTLLERKDWSRHIWNLPLFFFALFAFAYSLFGLVLFR